MSLCKPNGKVYMYDVDRSEELGEIDVTEDEIVVARGSKTGNSDISDQHDSAPGGSAAGNALRKGTLIECILLFCKGSPADRVSLVQLLLGRIPLKPRGRYL